MLRTPCSIAAAGLWLLAAALSAACGGELITGEQDGGLDHGAREHGALDQRPPRDVPPGQENAPPPPDKGPPDKPLAPDKYVPKCGDSKCETGETAASCPKDCAKWWQPKPGTTWHWQLKGTISTSHKVKMYDIDLFLTKTSLISTLKSKGYKVICYFSAGTLDKKRPDAASFPSAVVGKKMEDWEEWWLDIRAAKVRTIMGKRLDLAKSKGCNGVEPDNVDGYINKTDFSLSYQHQISYNRWLATEAHKRELSVGLKNDLGQVKDLVKDFDWALNEECLDYNECSKLTPFINAGKAVFHVEYDTSASSMCPKIKKYKFDSQVKNWDVDAWSDPCWP